MENNSPLLFKCINPSLKIPPIFIYFLTVMSAKLTEIDTIGQYSAFLLNSPLLCMRQLKASSSRLTKSQQAKRGVLYRAQLTVYIIYIRTVSSQLLLCNGIVVSILAGLGQKSIVLSMLPCPNGPSISFNWISKEDNRR